MEGLGVAFKSVASKVILIHHFALSQDSCLGDVDRYYIPKCLNTLKEDSRRPGRALQKRRLNRYTYSLLRLVQRLVLGGLVNNQRIWNT